MRALALVVLGLLLPLTALAMPVCRYDVDVSASMLLAVSIQCPSQVRALQAVSGVLQPLDGPLAPERAGHGLDARYRLDLRAVAARENSIDSALVSGDSVIAVASAWLARPLAGNGEDVELEVRVRTTQSIRFETSRALSGNRFRIRASELHHAGFSAFGKIEQHTLSGAGVAGDASDFTVVLLDGRLDLGRPALLEWIARMAEHSAAFWQGFPVPGMRLFVIPRAGRGGVPFGRAMTGGGVSMALYVGEHASAEELRDDWVLIHELIHIGSPFVPRAPWLTEGLATYFEPLIRARVGLQSEQAMWREFVTYMPRGASVMRSSGLSRGGFRGWYWGGALLMLLTDVEMRRASHGARGLEDCLRDVRHSLGNYRRIVALERMVSACDAAVGGRALGEMVERYARRAGEIDLDGLWRDLGVALVGDTIELDDTAPLASLRKAIVHNGLPAGAPR